MKHERGTLRLLCAMLLQGSLLPCTVAGEAPQPAAAANEIQAPAADAAGLSPVTRALRVTGPVHLDGILDEEDWAHAEPITSFTQRFPAEGRAATEATEVRILFDAEHLYIGVLLRDQRVPSIVAREMKEDANLDNDDSFAVF